MESPSSGDVTTGNSVTLTLILSAAVTVAGGAPTLSLNDGGTATYTGGSGNAALTLRTLRTQSDRAIHRSMTYRIFRSAPGRPARSSLCKSGTLKEQRSASSIVPEPRAVIREGDSEASVGECMGQAMVVSKFFRTFDQATASVCTTCG